MYSFRFPLLSYLFHPFSLFNSPSLVFNFFPLIVVLSLFPIMCFFCPSTSSPPFDKYIANPEKCDARMALRNGLRRAPWRRDLEVSAVFNLSDAKRQPRHSNSERMAGAESYRYKIIIYIACLSNLKL